MPAQTPQQIIEELMPKVYGYFFRRCNECDAVDDLAMSTLTKLYEKLEYQKVQNPYAYCWQIAKHELYEHWRKRGKYVEFPAESEDFSPSAEYLVWQTPF